MAGSETLTEADIGRRLRLAAANGQPQQMATLISFGATTAVVRLNIIPEGADDDGIREVPFDQIEKVVRNG